MTNTIPEIALIIPSLTGAGKTLLTSIARQTLQPQIVEVVVGVAPNGRARNLGVAHTTADLLLFMDDDAVPGNTQLVAQLVAPLLADPTVGVTGAARILPPDASAWQRYVAREVPRIVHPVVATTQETNPDPPSFYCDITTTCCAMRRAVFTQVGGFNETLIRGVDTEFFVRVRRQGYRLLLVGQTWVYHPAPNNLQSLLHKHFLYGMGHAQEVWADPTRARGRWLHTPLHAAGYVLLRTLLLLPNTFLPYSFAAPTWQPGCKPLKALTSYVTALGYVAGWYTVARRMRHVESTERTGM